MPVPEIGLNSRATTSASPVRPRPAPGWVPHRATTSRGRRDHLSTRHFEHRPETRRTRFLGKLMLRCASAGNWLEARSITPGDATARCYPSVRLYARDSRRGSRHARGRAAFRIPETAGNGAFEGQGPRSSEHYFGHCDGRHSAAVMFAATLGSSGERRVRVVSPGRRHPKATGREERDLSLR